MSRAANRAVLWEERHVETRGQGPLGTQTPTTLARGRPLRRVVLVLFLALFAAPPHARAEQIIVDDPTFSGPSASINYVAGAGWDGDFDWTYAEGIDHPEV